MNGVLFPLMLVSGYGLILSIAAHVMALAGFALPVGKLVWALHIGIVIVWLPIFSVLNRYANRKDFWKVALAG